MRRVTLIDPLSGREFYAWVPDMTPAAAAASLARQWDGVNRMSRFTALTVEFFVAVNGGQAA